MKSKRSPWQIAGLIASAVPTLFLAFHGIRNLFTGNALFTPFFAVVFFVLPVVATVLLWCLILWRKKVWVRLILAVLILALLSSIWFFTVVLGTFREQTVLTGTEALASYAEKSYPDGMPDDFGSPTDVQFVAHTKVCALFRADSDTLILTYAPEEYAARTAELDRQAIFHTEPLPTHYHTPEIPLYPEFSWDNWYFRYLNMDGTDLDYPKEMILVGINDAEYAISYVYFRDVDLDYIDSHEEFLLNECGWQYLP